MTQGPSPAGRPSPARGLALCALLLLPLSPHTATAQSCTREAFRQVVDDTGKTLRRYHAESQGRLTQGFRRLKELHGWSEDEHIDRAMAEVADQRGASLDAKSAELLARLDQLAEVAPGPPDCGRLGELEATALELQATVRAKTEYTIARLDQLAREKSAPAQPPGPSASAQPKPSPAPPVAAKPPPASAPPPRPTSPGWSTTTRETAPPPAPPPPAAPPADPAPVAGLPPPSTDGFSSDEIREASRGFFGTISTGLGTVIEHAFARAGRPTGYVLGNEGGGAFIAGVRYGKGTLFTRGGKSREVYWHGPSVGYDFGASGAKVLFLVYNLSDELDIFSGFSGVEGSAYLVGGVGLTFVSDGRVVLAPIRSGIGLRLGASVGYLRFTAQPTWNPF